METSEAIAQAKGDVSRAKEQLLKTFAFVPDEKLNWSPSATARTPLWIVGHCGSANGAFATLLRGEPLPLPLDPAEAAALIHEGGKNTATREEAVQSIEDSVAKLLAALDTVTPERLASSPDSPFGQIPFAFWMGIPAEHMVGHSAQLDYMETIWGDMTNH